ncbi:MAG: Catalase-related peroxidase [Pseudomonas sp.]|nr:MAG: Catalase-related peroxidase [Pseudomonas sp.]
MSSRKTSSIQLGENSTSGEHFFQGGLPFRFINAAGTVTFGRYQLLPVSGAHYLSDAQTAKAKPDYLSEEILHRVTQGPVAFKLVVQVAEPGDKLDDPSITWSDKHRLVELGTLQVTRAVADNAAAQKSLMFLPNNVPAGIEPQDPMINARSAAYPVSFGRRQ